MIILDNVSVSFGRRAIFNKISCNINRNSRIGLVGRNGSGKSTLLKVIAGLQGIDDGTVSIEKNTKIGYMPQEVVLQSNKTILQETLFVFDEITSLLEESKSLEKRLSDGEAVERYSQVQERLLELDVSGVETEAKKILVGLGFAPKRFDELVSNLSVGWRMRVVLAKLLLQKADFYLFDEPTNHLDIVTKDWFLQFLKESNFGFMLVCHDRYFLDHLCDKILELENGKGLLYHGNYTFYAEQKELRVQVQEQAAIKQQKEIAKKMKTVERFRASASKARMAQAMLKKIEKIERIEKVQHEKTMAFSFPTVDRAGKVVLKVRDVGYSFGEHVVFKNVSFEVERGERVAIVAPNGVGKTTLFNLITNKLSLKTGQTTGGFNPLEFGYNVKPAFFEQDQEKVLNKDNTIYEEVLQVCHDSETRALVRKFLGAFLFSGDDVNKKISVLSGGEKNRVAMVKVLLQKANLLFLDEPTNHLDIQSKEILYKALLQFKGTILFVSHDRDFLDKLATRILELSPNRIVSYPGNYDSYLYHKQKEKEQEKDLTTSSKDQKKQVGSKELYERRRLINKFEGKIDRLEKRIARLNKDLEDLEYGTEAFQSTYEQLIKSQKELEETIAKWEKIA